MTTTRKPNPRKDAIVKPVRITIWENLQLLTLAGSVGGQIIVGQSFLIAQLIWFAANIIALSRDFVLHRPMADKIKNTVLTGITAGIIVLYLCGGYGN